MVASADAGRTRVVRIADRWATRLVAVVMVLVLATYLLTWDIYRAVTIMIVFCPCAFILATPTAVVAAIGNLTRYGLLVKDGDRVSAGSRVMSVSGPLRGLLTAERTALNILMIYDRLKNDTAFAASFPPTTFLFGGKAAPGYVNAKLIIKFINNIAHVINTDPAVRGKLAVFFMPNYRVTMAEHVIPCTNISEQISTAGLEASGTGNMKFMVNGALTMGTLDGANVEIAQEVGDENIFIFGHKEEEIVALKKDYRPMDWVEKDELIRRVVELVDNNHFNLNEPGIFEPLRRSLFEYGDKYCIFADLRMYHDRHNEATDLYKDDFDSFCRKSILNIAASGKFSSDRTIKEYADEIWHVSPCPVKKSTKDSVLEDAFNPLFNKETTGRKKK